ncbi:MAG: glucokinase [Anaerolineales bacterium]|nr:glucokinase [Anaerolineales bacterium]
MILAGDIGGTKTVLALFSETDSMQHPLHELTYPSARYTSLEAIVAEFLAEVNTAVSAATFGVAGPVVKGRAKITNLPWLIDAARIAEQFAIPHVHLLNDLEAIATAVPHLQPADLATLSPGTPDPAGAIAVIAPGTGLGEAFLVWNGQRYRAHPTEGGHVSFAPGTPEELALLQYLQPRFGHVSFERVCSGSGIPNLYDYLRASGRFPEPDWLCQALAAAADRTPVIFQAAAEHADPLCSATLDLFAHILAGEAGNMALKVLATGGVYLGGGIPPRLLPRLQQPDFLQAFMHKGRFSSLLAQIPVHVILHPKVALLGAAYDGLETFA